MSEPSAQPVTMVISETVKSQHQAEYENWVAGINREVKQFAGFMGVDIIRPRDKNQLEYVVIVRFACYSDLTAWRESQECQSWLKKAEHMVKREVVAKTAQGMEMWFSLPKADINQAIQPPFYKQVIIGLLAVYPLVLLIDHTIGPFIQHLNYFVRIFISVTLISIFITYPMMPLLTKILNNWLYQSDLENKKTPQKRRF